jgi:hypothetical protein
MIDLTQEQDAEIKRLFKFGIFTKEEFKIQMKSILQKGFFWLDKKATCKKCGKHFWFKATEELFTKKSDTFCSKWCMERYQKI